METEIEFKKIKNIETKIKIVVAVIKKFKATS